MEGLTMFECGKVYHGFRLTRQETVAEVQSEALVFEHEPTKAELVVFPNEEDNKVFMIAFRTPPTDDSGLPHILEHSVLNGSAKYPLKEPFAELLKASLYTFLNAMTYPDKTVYPVASRNQQDFHNLMDVYLDAVFNPNLTRQTFMQEGWHYQLESGAGEMTYSGVVYNEMQGAYSMPETILNRTLEEALFPDSIYGKSSGGDPECIPELTYEAFTDFHRRYYHPSNSRICLYGDFDVLARLEHLQAFLSTYDYLAVDSAITPQPRRDEPVTRHASYPITPGESAENKSYVLRAYLIDAPDDAETHLALQILSRILVGTPASPLRKALIDAQLGEDTLNYGVEEDILDRYFAVGLRGTNPDKAEDIHRVIDATLAELATNGIPPKTVEAAVNSTEFMLREANYGGYAKGLIYALTMTNSWLYGQDPLMHLRYEPSLRAVKEGCAAGGYFEAMIQRCLLDNQHQARVVMTPDADMEAKRLDERRAALAAKKETLADDEASAIVAACEELARLQVEPDSPEALACIPKLPLDCIDKKAEVLPFELLDADWPRLSFSRQATNGIAYLQLAFDADGLPAELLPYLPAFGQITLQAGTSQRDFVDLNQEIDIHTGGIGHSYSATSVLGAPDDVRSTLGFRGKALAAKLPRLCELLAEVLGECDLDNHARIADLLTIGKSRLRASIIPGGHSFAISRLAAYHSRQGMYGELTGGLSQYYFREQLVETMASAPDQVIDKLKQVRQFLFNAERLHLHLTGSDEELAALRQALPTLLAALGDAERGGDQPTFAALEPDEGLIVPSKIQYVGKGANLYDLGFEYNGNFEVLNKLLGRDFLWNKVRVQGGAYGCFASFNQLSGNLACVSYRDPNLRETLGVFDAIADYLDGLELSTDEFDKLLIGAMGSIDSPLSPDQKGGVAFRRYLTGVAHEEVQRRRDEMLGCRREDLRGYADLFRRFAEQADVCVVGGEELIERNRDCFQIVKRVFSDPQ